MRATIALPRSKSMANRALVLAALADALDRVVDPGDAEDTRILLQLLHDRPKYMHCGAGGTTFRFLLAWACVQEGEEHVITGDTRLLERPHDALVEALLALGADLVRTEEGYRVVGRRMRGGRVTVHAPLSSQFISALLLVAPCFTEGLRLTRPGRRLSEPYVHMTLAVLAAFGVRAEVQDDTVYVPPGGLRPTSFKVPRDWSAAAFWFQIAALADDATITLPGLVPDGRQGDEAVMGFMENRLLCRVGPDGVELRSGGTGEMPDRLALSATPDLFQPLVFSCLRPGVRPVFEGLHNLPWKETDRIAAVAEVLGGMALPTTFADGTFRFLTELPPMWSQDHRCSTYGDHRMAMAIAPLALLFGRITVMDPDVVGKSYPAFWDDLRRAGFVILPEG